MKEKKFDWLIIWFYGFTAGFAGACFAIINFTV